MANRPGPRARDETFVCGLLFFMRARYDIAMQKIIARISAVGPWFVGASAIIALLSPILMWPVDWYAPLQSVRFIAVCVALVLAGVGVLIASACDREWIAITRHPAMLIGVVFTIYLVVRSVISPDIRMWFGSWARFDGLWMWVMSVFFLNAWAALIKKNERAAAYSALAFCFIIILSTFVSRINAEDLRWSGLTGNANYLAGLLLLMPWAVLFAKKFLWPRVWRYALVIVSLTTVFLMYQTDSRGVFVAAGVGVATYFFSLPFSWRKKIIIASVGLLLLGGLYTVFSIRHVGVRDVLARAAISDIARAPVFGYGWGSHVRQIATHAREAGDRVFREQVIDTSHSALLDVALAGGTVGVLLIAALLFFLWRDAVPFERAVLAAGAAWHVVAFVNPWTLLGFVFFAATIIARSQRMVDRRVSSAIVVALWCMMIGVSAVAGWAVARDAGAVARGELINSWSPVAADQAVQTVVRVSRDKQKFATALRTAESLALSGYDWHTLSSAARAISYEQALVYNDRALALTPTRQDTIILRADILRELGRHQEAVATMQQFAATSPNLPQAHFYYGVLLSIYGQREAAAQEMKRAFELLPRAGWDADQTLLGEEIILSAGAVAPRQ